MSGMNISNSSSSSGGGDEYSNSRNEEMENRDYTQYLAHSPTTMIDDDEDEDGASTTAKMDGSKPSPPSLRPVKRRRTRSSTTASADGGTDGGDDGEYVPEEEEVGVVVEDGSGEEVASLLTENATTTTSATTTVPTTRQRARGKRKLQNQQQLQQQLQSQQQQQSMNEVVTTPVVKKQSSSASSSASGGGVSGGAAASTIRKKKTTSRDENSLRHLTTRFMELISQTENGLVDLNVAAQMLGVQKRRIYDITNVLEGIGLIDKKSKNLIEWKNTGITISNAENANVVTTDDDEEIQELRQDIAELELQEQILDTQIEQAQTELRKLTESEEYQQRAYVTYNDIRNIESLRDRTIIAIRAPSGTTLTVPDPDEGMIFPHRRYQIYLTSPSEPIKVYLLSNDEQQDEQQQQLQQQQLQLQADQQRIEGIVATAPVVEPRTPDRNGLSLRQLEPPPTDPDFIYSMDPVHEGITDLYRDDMGGSSGLLFDAD